MSAHCTICNAELRAAGPQTRVCPSCGAQIKQLVDAGKAVAVTAIRAQLERAPAVYQLMQLVWNAGMEGTGHE